MLLPIPDMLHLPIPENATKSGDAALRGDFISNLELFAVERRVAEAVVRENEGGHRQLMKDES